MNFISLITILLFVGCTSQRSEDSNNIAKIDSLKTTLLGQWGGLGEASPVLEIKSDSIYYFEEKKSYPYEIIGTDLVIRRAEYIGVLKNISVLQDTMTFYDEQQFSIKAYRFK
ncbi:MAG TPA: hypothetical protein VFV31_08900 [Chitinophagaceae bacterium]|nr:hypothetical protein [Chitinophagaceae bacterium]